MRADHRRWPGSPVLLVALCIAACGGTPTTPSTAFEFSLTPTTVAAGAPSQGTVTLSGPTRSAVQVNLSSSDAVAAVPASIMVPSGTTGGTFTVATRVVAADTIATITASMGGEKREVALHVMAPIARPSTLESLELDASVLRGGQSAQGTVRLTGAAPAGGLSVSLRSSNSAATVPNSVTVQAGALSATFLVTTQPVSVDTQFEITASFSDQTRTVPIRVTP